MTLLFDPPTPLVLPLVKGSDLVRTFIYKQLVGEDWVETPWPTGTLTLVIETGKETSISTVLVVTGSSAQVVIDHSEIDLVKVGCLWRLVKTDVSGNDTVVLNGTTDRYDGKAKT